MVNIPVVQASMAVLACFIYRQYIRKKTGPRLPPGPKPLPIVGNILDLPPQGVPEFQHWLKHKETYGPISSVTVMGQTLIVIHDKQAVNDLLEKKSVKTSGRPAFEFASRLCGADKSLGNQQYDDNFRRSRRFVHQQLGTAAAVAQYNDLQQVEVRRFLLRVLNRPEDLFKHLNTATGSIILKMSYGYCIGSAISDPLTELIERMMHNLSLATVPLAWLVDVVPALNYLPDWFPGTSFKETARRWNKINQATADIPYSFVRRQMATHNYRPSYVSNLVQQCTESNVEGSKLSRDDEDAIKWTAATMYFAGTHTTALALSTFILAMVMFPNVQRKAQEEIGRVIGTDRLPQFMDRVKLPYIEGVVKEVFRWSPSAPMGFPHVATEDIVYDNYLIPKGAYLLPAAWWFLHDPEVYADPSSFNPERYLEPHNEPDPRPVAFGYGRRICPGQYFADSTAFLTIVQTLAAFNISKAVDEQGIEIEATLKVTPGVISHLVNFPYKIVPRGEKQSKLVRSVEVEHPWEESDASFLGSFAIQD